MASPTFYWGVGIENCWMAEHNELNRSGKRLLDVYLLMQHYTRWREDLDTAAHLGVKALRYSVPWYRANSSKGSYDWSWIEQPLDYMVNQLGITPVIDLIHYGTPLWLENGVLNHDYPQRIADYAAAFAQHFKGLVTHYTPHNEPQVGATYAGYQAYWPPYLIGLDGWVKIGLNLGKGMILTSQALRAELVDDVVLISADCLVSPPSAEVAQAVAMPLSDLPSPDRERYEYQLASFPASLAYGTVAPDSPFARTLVHLGASEEQILWYANHAQAPDIVGHNYYPVCFDPDGSVDMERLARANEELRARLAQAASFFDRPVYLTETSAGHTGEQKGLWMQAAYEVVASLRSQGTPVVGINWWPLFDTVQWEYRDSTKTITESIFPGIWNNGLYTIEERFDGTLSRIPTGAINVFRTLIAEHPNG